MGGTAIKNPRRIFSQNGGETDPTIITRLEYLENNESKVTYFESVSSSTGTITIPTGATILLDQFRGGVDAYVSTIENGQPTGILPQTSGGVAVDVTSFDALGNYTLSGTPDPYPVAIIYILEIPASSYQNLTTANILSVDTNDVLSDVYTLSPIISGTKRGFPGTISTVTNGLNTATWLTPYLVGKNHSVDSISIYVGNNIAASTLKMALYASDGYLPTGDPIIESGTISSATSGYVTFSFTSTLLTAPLYWMALQMSSASSTFRFWNGGGLTFAGGENVSSAGLPWFTVRFNSTFGTMPTIVPLSCICGNSYGFCLEMGVV